MVRQSILELRGRARSAKLGSPIRGNHFMQSTQARGLQWDLRVQPVVCLNEKRKKWNQRKNFARSTAEVFIRLPMPFSSGAENPFQLSLLFF